MAISREYCYASFGFERGAASVFPRFLKTKTSFFTWSTCQIFLELSNHFNRYLQGPESNIINFAPKLTTTAVIQKLNLWKKNSRTDNLECLKM